MTAKANGEPGVPAESFDSAVVPDYEVQLAARHAVFRRTFEQMIDTLPVADGDRVMDIGCGDGYFLDLLSTRHRPCAVGLDVSASYLSLARKGQRHNGRPVLVCGQAERVPCRPGSFDLVWSGQSMQSYADAGAVIAEAYRVLRPGGLLAILENDRLHARVLPLSPEIEIALLAKVVAAVAKQPLAKAFQARWCEQLLEAAGFSPVSRTTWVLERQTPWSAEAQQFYELLLKETLDNARRELTGPLRAEAEATLEPTSERYLGTRRFRFFSELHTLFVARKAENSRA